MLFIMLFMKKIYILDNAYQRKSTKNEIFVADRDIKMKKVQNICGNIPMGVGCCSANQRSVPAGRWPL